MNKTMLYYKNTMAMLAFIGLTFMFTDAMLISKLRHAGTFLGLKTGAWRGMSSVSNAVFMMLTLANLAYRKDELMFIKECFLKNKLPKNKMMWH